MNEEKYRINIGDTIIILEDFYKPRIGMKGITTGNFKLNQNNVCLEIKLENDQTLYIPENKIINISLMNEIESLEIEHLLRENSIKIGWFSEMIQSSNELVKNNLDDLYLILFEKSHGNLKYTYRMGFDISTGKQVAVQFILEPEKITGVGDPRLTNDLGKEEVQRTANKLPMSMSAEDRVKYVLKNRDRIDKETEIKHLNALDKVKKTIRKWGHIDHITDALTVKAIFTSDKKPLQNVKLIPLIPAINHIFREIAMEMNYMVSPESKDFDKFLSNSDVRKKFIERAKKAPANKIESYHVSKNDSEEEKQGKNKYKSTKLMFDIPLMSKLQFTPAHRGVLSSKAKSSDEVSYDEYDINNKPKRK